MDDASSSGTRVSLLARLREDPADQSAWQVFVERYGPTLKAWCRHWKLQESDAEDVTQQVLLKLAVKLRHFVYDPERSFRAWLKTIARHAWSDFVAEQQRVVTGSGDSQLLAVLHTQPARADLESRLEAAFDLELLEIASERVRDRVKPTTWEAFRLTALEGLSGAEAAGRLGMQVAAVFMAKRNVQKLLQEEIRDLESRGPP
jgi:RNA polymerase sigma-70 factor (ECF subfamily)